MAKNSNKFIDKTFWSYCFGFLVSIFLSLQAYYLVVRQTIEYSQLLFLIMFLAVIQLAVQLVFFLHVTEEKKPRLNLQILFFAIFTVLVIVFGSLWIMSNLDKYHGAKPLPEETKNYIIEDEGFSN